MSMNPNNAADLKRLRLAVEHSRKELSPFRRARKKALDAIAGAHYNIDKPRERVPINLVEMALNIYVSQLAAKAPAAMVSTANKRLRPRALNLELALNHLFKEVKLGRSLRYCVRDAMLSVGIIKVMLEREGVEIDGEYHDAGKPYADAIDLDDWVHDMTARQYHKVAFAGHRFQLPYQYVMESSLYKNKDKLRPTELSNNDESGNEKAEALGRGESVNQDNYQDMVDLYELWLPEPNLIVTMPFEDLGTGALLVEDYNGPECGPYHFLGYQAMPNCVMPLPPVATWMDLHELANTLFRKLRNQAERAKEIGLYQGTQAADAERISEAKDGDFKRVDSLQATGTIKTGGVDPKTLAFLLQVKDLYSYLAGNLDALGGLSPQAGTLGQEELLTQNASKRVADMQSITIDFVAEVSQHLGFLLWENPIADIPITKKTKYGSAEIPIRWNEEQREGDYFQYNIGIHPYSMQHHTPAAKLQALTQIFNNFIAPYAPQLEAQGVRINFVQFMKDIQRLSNLDELDGILMYTGETPVSPAGEDPRQSPVTSRTNVRVNRPGGTRQGKDQAMSQLLLAGADGVQSGDTAGLMRMVG